MKKLAVIIMAFALATAGCNKDDEDEKKSTNNPELNRGEGSVTFRIGNQFFEFDVFDFELPWKDWCTSSNAIFCHTTIKGKGIGNSENLMLELQWPYFSAGSNNCDVYKMAMTVYNKNTQDTIIWASSFVECDIAVWSLWGLQFPERNAAGNQIAPGKLDELEAEFSGRAVQGELITGGSMAISLKD